MELENSQGSWSQRSDSIINLAKALCQTQATVEAVKKDANNPFFKSKYADLASIWHAIREALTSNGLSVLQEPSTECNKVRITTTLIHTSGEYVRSTLEVVAVKTDPQGIGSAITYARRYALGSIVGIAPEDDDGNAASGGNDKNRQQQRTNPQAVVPNLKSADQLQNEAAAKAFGSDDISYNSNGKPDMATVQKIKKTGVFTYDLQNYLEEMEPKKYNEVMRFLEKKQGFEVSPGIWTLPEYVEKMAQFLKAEDSVQTEAA